MRDHGGEGTGLYGPLERACVRGIWASERASGPVVNFLPWCCYLHLLSRDKVQGRPADTLFTLFHQNKFSIWIHYQLSLSLNPLCMKSTK